MILRSPHIGYDDRVRWLPTAVALLALVPACTNGVQLVADLKTDLRPGIEFASVETRVESASGDEVARAAVPAYTSTDFLSGQRAIEARALAPGTYLVSLRLVDRDGRELVHRDTRVRLDASSAITVLVTRDCAGVLCPTSADTPDASECLAGTCVRPECVVEDPMSCPTPACRAASECSFPASCAIAACVSGTCLARPDDTRCATGEWCDPTLGCRRLELVDGDAGPRDAGPSVDAAGDGGAVDAGPCVEGTPCDTGRACEIGRRDCSGGCVHDRFVGAGTECRAAAGPCDAAEVCTGATPTCPTDAFRTGGVCRGASGPCDVSERCDGTGPGCPSNGYADDGTNCGATWSELSCGPIDVDYCSGGSCVRHPDFGGGGSPSCGALGGLCGFSPACCGSGGFFCVDEPGNPIYGSSRDCGQCCRAGRCCQDGNPAGPCS